MRKFVGLILFLCLWTLSAKAQDYSKGEAFVGYQYTHANGPDLNGWNGALTYNLKDWLGVTADLTGSWIQQKQRKALVAIGAARTARHHAPSGERHVARPEDSVTADVVEGEIVR